MCVCVCVCVCERECVCMCVMTCATAQTVCFSVSELCAGFGCSDAQ